MDSFDAVEFLDDFGGDGGGFEADAVRVFEGSALFAGENAVGAGEGNVFGERRGEESVRVGAEAGAES